MLVAKFGGSSLSDSSQFIKVRNIINENPERRIVVLSAPGKRNKNDIKVTDLLLRAATRARNGQSFQGEFDEISKRFTEIANGCGIDINLEDELCEIKERISSECDSDYAASRGEYLSAKLMACLLGFTFVDAAQVIFFDKNGKVDENATFRAIKEAYSKNERIVIPGFYGSMPHKAVKTFSRGGSDITGALAAAAVGAEVYENWTDVSGILMADPRIVENPRPIKNITYTELRELSHMGACVLHEDAVYPVKSHNIPLNIRNTNSPSDQGTMVGNSFLSAQPVTGISGKQNYSVINVRTDDVSNVFKALRKILEVFDAFNVIIENAMSNQDGFSIIVSSENYLSNEPSLSKEINEICTDCTVCITHNISLISIVGNEIRNSSVCAYLINVLNCQMINVETIHQTLDCNNVIVGVSNTDFERTINALYDGITAMAI